MANENSGPVTGKPKSQQQVEEPATTPEEVVADPVQVAQAQNSAWHEITEHVVMNFRGKKQTFNEIVIYVRRVCDIGEYPGLVEVRNKEEKIGNLIADIYIQKSKAQYAYGKLEGQRISRLGKFVEVKDRRSTALIEARMAAHDEPYKAILGLISDCKSTLDFWHDMYNICLRTADRLKQISMALMAEMKLEPSENGGRGERVRGSH
jgi:hypothetical protein